MKENSQGGDLSTLEANSHGQDPRTFRDPVERWRVQEKQKEGREVEEKEEKKVKKKKVKYRGKSLWKKVQRKDCKLLFGREERRKCRQKRQEE